jgi:hypothetical protein
MVPMTNGAGRTSRCTRAGVRVGDRGGRVRPRRLIGVVRRDRNPGTPMRLADADEAPLARSSISRRRWLWCRPPAVAMSVVRPRRPSTRSVAAASNAAYRPSPRNARQPDWHGTAEASLGVAVAVGLTSSPPANLGRKMLGRKIDGNQCLGRDIFLPPIFLPKPFAKRASRPRSKWYS